MVRLDRINAALIEQLQKNGRTNLAELARAVRRGESTVRDRLVGLEAGGIIRGYHALVDWKQLGYGVQALVRAEPASGSMNKIAERLRAVPNVRSVLQTTDPRPILIEVFAKDVEDLNRILASQMGAAGLDRFDVAIVVNPLVDPRPLPVPVDGARRLP